MAPETFESRAKRPRRVEGCSIARRRDTTAIDETRTFGGYPRVESRRREAPGQVIMAHHRIHHRARVEMEKNDIDALRADDTGARRSSAS